MNPTFKNRPNELITTTDGRKLYHSRSVAVVAVLCCLNTTDDKYYFAIEKRGTNPGLDKQGLWCLPCGYLDFNESGKEAAKREVWEEIGLNLDEYESLMLEGPTLEQPWHVKTEPDENRQNVTLRYGMNFIKNPMPKLIPNNDAEPNEVAEAKWVTIEELRDYEFAFNHDNIIREYSRRFKL